MEDLLFQPNSILAIAGVVLTFAITSLGKKYLVPFLKIGKRKVYAQHILLIADEITDELRIKYPDKSWIKYLDEAVDKIMKVCNISQDVAKRAVNAAVSRK